MSKPAQHEPGAQVNGLAPTAETEAARREKISASLQGNANNVKSPRSRALRLWRGAPRGRDRWALAQARDFAAARAEDLGGLDQLTEGQRSLLEAAALCRGVISLILSASNEQGGLMVADKEGQPALSPAAKEIPKFIAQLRALECELGLARRSKPLRLADIAAPSPVIDVGPESDPS